MEDQPLYASSNTAFCAYVLAAGLLRYARAALSPDGRQVEFAFADPRGDGPELLRNWNAGIVQLVNPRVLLESRNKLVDEVKRLKNGSK